MCFSIFSLCAKANNERERERERHAIYEAFGIYTP
jgi:hypothetical protein